MSNKVQPKRKEKIDWLQLKKDYLTGSRACDLAKKHHIGLPHLENKISKLGWRAEKKVLDSQMVVEHVKKYTENIVDMQIAKKEKLLAMFDDLLEKSLVRINKKKLSNSSFYQLIRSIDIIKKDIFSCLGIPENGKQEFPGDVPSGADRRIVDALSQVPVEEIVMYARRFYNINTTQ